jgi:hypothetical protein
MQDCLVHECAHPGGCALLGYCGANRAFDMASRVGGYEVYEDDNLTLDLLLKHNMVRVVDRYRDRVTIVAVEPEVASWEHT